jgi:hypothetical protein
VRPNAISSARVENGTLLASDFKAGQLPAGPKGAKGDTGAQGLQGPKGDPGAKGDEGQPGFLGDVAIQREEITIQDNGNSYTVGVECPAGTKIIGGGSSLDDPDNEEINTTVSRPGKNGGGVPSDGDEMTEWRATWVNPSGGVGDVGGRAWAVCISMPAI